MTLPALQAEAGQPGVLIKEETIRGRVDELARRISREYAEMGASEVLLVGVLRGAFIFLADLTRRLAIPHRVDFIAVSAYGDSASAGAVRLVKDLTVDVTSRHVLVVEDIVDTGRTLRYLLDLLGARAPASLKTCVLVRKPARRAVDVPRGLPAPPAAGLRVDYVGFEIPDQWVVGYGLDFKDRWRTLPYIGVVDPD